MENVVTLKPRQEQIEEKQRQDMLDVIDHLRGEIAEGRVREFVATSMSDDGEAQIHVCTLDLPGSIGLYEIGKHILITQQD
jgi:hypothetical protein